MRSYPNSTLVSEIVILLVKDLIGELSKPYEGYSWIAIILLGRDWLLLALIVALFVAMRSWKKEKEYFES